MFKINDNYLKLPGKLSVFQYSKKEVAAYTGQILTERLSVWVSAT